MAHCIEVNDSMFSVREKPWHYAETADRCKIIQEAPTSKEALEAAGLGWSVEQIDIFDDKGNAINNYKANIRSDDRSVLGIVTGRYKIVQNEDAFAFTDGVIGDGVRYETAGSLFGGKKVWLLAKMPDTTILGDKVEPYMCFANSHDGTGAIKVCMTPIRVVCNNTLSIAMNGATRAWSTKHIGDIKSKMEEAKMCLELAQDYMVKLDEEADRYANAKLDYSEVNEILDEMFPVKEDYTERRKENVQKVKDSFQICYFMPDIEKYRGTAWGAINAMSDFVGHSEPVRRTQKYDENRWARIMDGHVWMDNFVRLVNERVSK